MEAELHYDFESPPWLKYMTKEKYEPGDGHVFGLGRRPTQPLPSDTQSYEGVSCALARLMTV
jgi:hypothetical protein